MKVKVIAGIVCALCMGVFAQTSDVGTSDSSSKADNRVRRALESAGLKYSVDGDGDFRVHFKFKSGRTHLVFVNSETERYDGLELRRVWAFGFVSDKEVSKNNLQVLLERNGRYKLGAWNLQKHRRTGKWSAEFRVVVPADCPASELRSIIELTADVADEIEKESTGADKL